MTAPRSPPAAALPQAAEHDARLAVFLAIVTALTVVRLIGLAFSAVDFDVEESQYWSWSRDLAFGYFSKPPLIAWIMAAADTVCGSGEACIRAPAPLLYLGTSLLVYRIGRRLYDADVAFWAGMTAVIAPGIAFSARLMTTDVPLLFFWALALLAYVQLLTGASRRWAVVLALAMGFGLLSKYAMVYFVPAVVVAGLADRRARALLAAPTLWLALAAGAAFLVPNLIWNLGHGESTIAHTAANIRGPGIVFNLGNALAFVAAQFAVGGPVVFGTLLLLAARIAGPSIDGNDRVMLAFSLPILAVIAALAFVTQAYANWAATAFVSAFVVTAAVLVRRQRFGWIFAGIGFGVVCQVGLLVADPLAYRVTLPFLNAPDPYWRTLGWRELGDAAGAAAARNHVAAIVAAARSDVASLTYYARETGLPVYAWPQAAGPPTDHFQLTRPLPADAGEPILAVADGACAAQFAGQFGIVTPLGEARTTTGPTTSRTRYFFLLGGRQAPVTAPGPCPPTGD